MAIGLGNIVLESARLRTFARLCGKSTDVADRVVREHLEELARCDTSASVRDVYRRVHSTLTANSIADTAHPSLPITGGIFARFNQLRSLQRTATFLVIYANFSFAEAAEVLGASENLVAMEIIAALFVLEHVSEPPAAPDSMRRARSEPRATPRPIHRTPRARVTGAGLQVGAFAAPPLV